MPCASGNSTEPTEACCAGLFVDVPTVKDVVVARWAEAGCFCLKEVYDYDPIYFERVFQLAAKCPGKAALVVKNNCPLLLPANGFTKYKTMQDAKDAVEAMAIKPPPAPPAVRASDPAPSVLLNIRLPDYSPKLLKDNRVELANEIAAFLGLSPGQVKFKMVAKGSAIITAEVSPVEGTSTLTSAEMDVIKNKLQDAQANTAAGAFLSPKYGSMEATSPASGGTATPAPPRPTGQVPKPAPPGLAPSLPDTVLGLPRVNPLNGNEYTGGFEVTNEEYIGSLLGQGLPGIAMAIILLVAMVLMGLVYVVSSVCGATLCKCCNGAYKPRSFSKRDLLINKFVMFGFCVLTAIGCFIVFAETGPLLDSTKDLTSGLTGTVADLTASVLNIADTLSVAAKDPTLKTGGNVTKNTENMKDAAVKVNDVVQKAQKDIDDAIDMGGGYSLIGAGVMFGVSFMVFGAGLIGWYRLLILLMVILSIFLILGWIVWGVLSITTVLIDDLCVAMKAYLADSSSSELKDLIPCLEVKVAVEVMNRAREMVASGIAAVNDEIKDYAGSNPYLRYLCTNYVKIEIEDLCNTTTPFYDQDYTRFVCKAYHDKKLEGLEADPDGSVYAYPSAYCPYPTAYYSVAIGNFSKPAPTGLRNLRCPFSSKMPDNETINTFGVAQCYVVKQIPSDIFDSSAGSGALAQSIIDIVPDIESILQCKFVDDAFTIMSGPCGDMSDSLANLWAGFLLVALGYFCIWVSAIVVISRLRFYDEYCKDGPVSKM